MAASPTTYLNEIRTYPDKGTTETERHYGGTFYGGAQTYGDFTIKRSRTRFKNESRFKDEDTIR